MIRPSTSRCLPLVPVLLALSLVGPAAELARGDEEVLAPIDLNPRNDKLGFRWDLTRQGYVNSGTSYTFARAMVLTVDDAQVNPTDALMSPVLPLYVFRGTTKSGAEFERRVTLDLDAGSARFVDTFRNSTQSPINLRVKLYTRLARPCDEVISSAGRTIEHGELNEDEVGILGLFNNNSPSVTWTVASPRAGLRPSYKESGKRTFEFEFALRVPPRGERSLVSTLVQAKIQGRPEPKDLEGAFAKLIAPEYVADLPPATRRTLINFENVSEGPTESLLGGVEDFVSKHEVERATHDTVLLGQTDSMVGALEGGSIVVQTAFGRAEVSLSELLLWRGGGRVGHPQLLALSNGEILRGAASCEGLSLGTQAGVKLPLAPEGFIGLVRRQASPTPEPSAGVYLETQDGTRLLLREPLGPLLGLTPWGPLTSELSQVLELRYGGPGYVGLMATLRDGTRLPLVPRDTALRLDAIRVGALELAPHQVKRLWRVGVAEPELLKQDDALVTHAELVGGAVLVGQLELSSLALITKTGTSTIALAQIRALRQLQDEDQDEEGTRRELRFEVVLWSKEKLEGRLELERLPVRTARGLREVPSADLLAYRQVAPAVKPTGSPEEGAKTPPGGEPETPKAPGGDY